MTLTIDLPSDTEIRATRQFNGTPEQVYRAHTEAHLIQQWLLGPEGWTMPTCISDARAGGHFHYEYTNGTHSFTIAGDYISATPYSRLEHVERMFLPDPTPDMRVITEFSADGPGTRMVMRMLVADLASRDAMLATGMTKGMEDSYARLDRQTAGVAA